MSYFIKKEHPIYDKALIVVKSPQELATSGNKTVYEQAKILGDAFLRYTFSRLYISMVPGCRSEDLSTFLAKSLSSDSVSKMCDALGLSVISSTIKESSKVRCEIFEAYVGYVMLSKGVNKGSVYLLDMLNEMFTQCFNIFSGTLNEFSDFL